MIGELFAGFHGGSKFSKNKKELKIFLHKEGVRIIDVSIETSEIFGEIKSELSRKGKQARNWLHMMPISKTSADCACGMSCDDPIVSEIRKIREEIFRQHNWSISEYHNDIMQKQQEYKDRLVTLEPKRKSQTSKHR